ncbi:MAG: carboxyl transferase domain-containing protein [Microthrixaceae bacterium]
MIGTAVERQGIIRHGAKMITAVSEATVPKISVILRKAYGAGLYAMAGPAFDPVATLALPTAKIAVMGPEAAVNAVFANKIAEIEDPDEQAAFVAERREEYEADVDLLRLASELAVDAGSTGASCAGRSTFASCGPNARTATSPIGATASRRCKPVPTRGAISTLTLTARQPVRSGRAFRRPPCPGATTATASTPNPPSTPTAPARTAIRPLLPCPGPRPSTRPPGRRRIRPQRTRIPAGWRPGTSG